MQDNCAVSSSAARLLAQLAPSISDPRVLEAIAATPREAFLSGRQRRHAYDNSALPIDCGQTISQPIVVGRMLELLELSGAERVLDVGTGSGYHAALLARLSRWVFSIERHRQLSELARSALASLAITNVTLTVGDGGEGVPEHAPYDAINVAAAVGDEVPAALIEQLAPGGRLVAPVGGEEQYLVLLRRTPSGLQERRCDPVRFVPLVRRTPA